MDTTYDVKIHETYVYKSKKKNGNNTYYVRWSVKKQRLKLPFSTSTLADSFRSDLVAAARRGEAFRISDGLPVSMARNNNDMNWYDFVCAYVDVKWPRSAATTRQTHAEAFIAMTPAMFINDRDKPDDKLIRRALRGWAFNTNRRNDPQCPSEIRAALRWVQAHTRLVSALRDPMVLRSLLDGLTVRLDGGPFAASVVSRRRKILNTAVEYAVERELLERNPIPALKWAPPKTATAVDRRRVVNPVQARTLLDAVREQQRSGPRLVAFFGCLYFAALRPEEAVALYKRNLSLPAKGWGEFHLDSAEPYAGKGWTDSGKNRDVRQLKQRAVGEGRTVPCPPELTALLQWHINKFGFAADGRLFTGERNCEEVPKLTIARVWARARRVVFTPEVALTLLAKTPYDLRHAAVSTWLNGGVPPTTVAEWAGHSVKVLLEIYAKCLDGTDAMILQRVEAALGQKTE